MRQILRITATTGLLTCLAALALGQAKPTTPAAPAIPDAVKAKYFKASAQALQAQSQLEQMRLLVTQRNTELQAAVSEITKACGDKFQPQMDKDGDPVCAAKPEAPKAPVK